jgi:hypothetical protein
LIKEEKIKHRKERQEKFKKAHPDYFKEYYKELKLGLKKDKKRPALFSRAFFNNLIRR